MLWPFIEHIVAMKRCFWRFSICCKNRVYEQAKLVKCFQFLLFAPQAWKKNPSMRFLISSVYNSVFGMFHYRRIFLLPPFFNFPHLLILLSTLSRYLKFLKGAYLYCNWSFSDFSVSFVFWKFYWHMTFQCSFLLTEMVLCCNNEPEKQNSILATNTGYTGEVTH